MFAHTLAESSLVQALNFATFVASITLLFNNALDIKYRQESAYTSDYFHGVMTALACVASCVQTVRTPLEFRDPGPTTAVHEDVAGLVFVCCTLYASLSDVITDPDLLSTSTFELVITPDEGLYGLLKLPDVDVQPIAVVGQYVVDAAELSKGYMLLVSLVYAWLYAFLTRPPRCTAVDRSPMRALVAVATVVNLVLTLLVAKESVADTASALLLVGISAYVSVFYEHFQYALPCLLANAAYVMARADSQGLDNGVFNLAVFMFVAAAEGIVAVGVQEDWWRVLELGPALLFKAGNILCIFSLLLAVVAYSADWIDFDFAAGGASQSAVDSINLAANRITDLTDRLTDVALVLDPCSKRVVPAVGEYEFQPVNDRDSLQESIRAARESAFLSGTSYSECIKDEPPTYGHKDSDLPHCVEMRENMTSLYYDSLDAITEAENALDRTYTTDDLSSELFVNEVCANAQCIALTVLTVAAVPLSFVPFVSGPTKAITMAARAANVVFRIGRKMTRMLPRMLRTKNKIGKLASRIVKLAVPTKSTLRLESNIAVIFLPIVVVAGVALSMLMFRRDVVATEQNRGVIDREGVTRRLSILLGLYAPLAVAEFVLVIVLHFAPAVVKAILDGLPVAFVDAEMHLGAGYVSLEMAYVISFIGVKMVILSVILSLAQETLLGLTRVSIRYLRKFLRSLPSVARRAVGFLRSLPKRMAGCRRSFRGAGYSRVAPADTGSRIADDFRWVAGRALNWNAQILGALVFCVPAAILVARAFEGEGEYIVVAFGANNEVAAANDELLETVLHKERSETMYMDLDDSRCGAVAALVKGLMSSVGGLQVITDATKDFADALTGSLDGVSDFVSQLSDLVDFDVQYISVTDAIVPRAVMFAFLFAVPIVNICTIGGMWMFAMANNGVDPRIVTGAAMFVMYTSVMNVVVHTVLGSLLTAIFSVDMPYVQMQATLGEAFYDTQIACMFTLLAAVSLYVNLLVPTT